MQQSVFGQILQSLVECHPTMLGAVFADSHGETIDLYHRDTKTDFDLQVLGAHLGVLHQLLRHTESKIPMGKLDSFWIGTDQFLYLLAPVEAEYHIGLWMRSPGPLGWARRQLAQTAANLRKEL